MLFVIVEYVHIAKVDLALALTATGKNSGQAFQLMKDTIKSIADDYQSQDIHYSLIVFSDEAEIKVSFRDNLEIPAVKESVDALLKPRGELDLEKGLLAARKEFQRSGVRPDASKVLVVLTDKSKGVGEEDVIAAAEGLTKIGVKVIPVAVGDEAHAGTLEPITSRKDNVVKAGINEDPKKLEKDIMKAVLSGKKSRH